MNNILSVKEAITLVLATVGATLGVINTWKAIDKDRPKLRVVPKQAFRVGYGSDNTKFLCFDVTNLSSFPITVTEVGVLYWWSRRRGAIIHPIIHDGKEFPRKLEPRTSFSAYAAPGALADVLRPIRCVYAKTDCGLIFKGSSPALRQLVKEENG